MPLVCCNTRPRAHESWSIASGWNLDPWIALPLAASGPLYSIGVARLWTHAGMGRGVRLWQALCFAAGWTTLLIALLSPLYRLGEGLFVARMVEHELVMVVAAPLLVLARPYGGMLWALPQAWRARIGALMRNARASWSWRAVGNA